MLSADGLPSYRDALGEVKLRNAGVRLLLQRVPGEEGAFIWKVSNATVAQLPELYQEYRYSAYVEWLFELLPEVTIFGIQLFKWAATLSGTLLATPVVLLLAWWLARLVVKPDAPIFPQVKRFLMGPVAVLILLIVFVSILQYLRTRGNRTENQSVTDGSDCGVCVGAVVRGGPSRGTPTAGF